MHESGDWAVSVFAKRIIRLTGSANKFASCGNNGFPERLQGVIRVEETHVVRGNGCGQQSATIGKNVTFFQGQFQHPFELLKSADAMSRLPAPVIPVGIGDIRIEAFAEERGSWILSDSGDGATRL
jgi:hypothetical protein